MNKIEATNVLKEFIETYIKSHGEEDVITVQLDNVEVEAFSTIVKELEKETVSRESYDNEYFLRKEHEVEIERLKRSIEALERKESILDILDKVRVEIKENFKGYDICEWFEDYDYEENNISEYRSVGNIDEILDIIDKYKEGVTPTCKKGHWIEVDTNMYTCSNCSHCFEIVPEVNSIHQFKCCPNCKTEMESEE